MIVDSTFVEVPRQHNTRGENEQIKRGELPVRFAQNKNVASHKDTEAAYRYKNREEFLVGLPKQKAQGVQRVWNECVNGQKMFV